MKRIALALIILGAAVYTVSAQTTGSYEFAGLVYNQHGTFTSYELCFNTSNTIECSEGKVDDHTIYTNIKIPLARLNALSKQGWEVYGVEVTGSARTWHLKRKIS